MVWGRFMGAATVARLHADPTFRADMEVAIAEVAAVRAKGVAPARDCAAEAAALAMGFQASDVTAIDILLEPDATMLRQAEANNARLLKVFPGGFALDATHTPHITMIQRFVRTADLDKVYAAADEVLARADVIGDEAGGLQVLLHPERRHRACGHRREADSRSCSSCKPT